MRQWNRQALLRTSVLAGFVAASAAATPALAQTDTELASGDAERITVTGTRIVRQDYAADSPIVTVSGDDIVANADITLDTFLNTLPQVNPAGTTTSNNPPNNGQSNVNLRGFGANRNLVLVDGRRTMPSAASMTVDLNTIPAALISRVEIVSGGAGAVYGADAVTGAVNIIMKDDFEGVDARFSYENSTEHWDAESYSAAFTVGGNFANDRGNAVLSYERSVREGMIKAQRDFAAQATATTTFFPEGWLAFDAANAPDWDVVRGIFESYGFSSSEVATNIVDFQQLSFNLDGTLIGTGAFNTPRNVLNWNYPVDDNIALGFFPDFYSFNFDLVNILTLPLERDSFTARGHYELDNGVRVFGSAGYTRYESTTGLAATPVPTVLGRNAADPLLQPSQFTSDLIEPGGLIVAQMVVPATNPFIPSDLAAILASRTGDDPRLVGSGADEPFLMRQRTLDAGIRRNDYTNTVTNFQIGASGPIGGSWEWNAYISQGRTQIDVSQAGNIDTQNLQTLLEAPDGGASICDGGFNPFGRQPISDECVAFLEVATSQSTDFTQDIAQLYVTGDVFEMPAGTVSVVLGAEYRGFEFDFDPGAASGPISGFNAQQANSGQNSFEDLFGEMFIPLVRDMPFIQSLDMTLGYRHSRSSFTDGVSGDTGGSSDSAYKVELSWQPVDFARVRASYQRAVRAPNFNELFGGSGSAPQIFDPCDINSNAASTIATLCADTGVPDPSSFVPTPGAQASISVQGSTDLNPESGRTYTVGMVFSSPVDGPLSALQGSIDYWNINVSGPILLPGVNEIIADCYNYFGNNPDHDASHASCAGLARSGGALLSVNGPLPGGQFPRENGGSMQASGIDLQLEYGIEVPDFGLGAGRLQAGLLMSHLLEWKQQTLDHLPTIDYAGTVAFFGSDFGTSHPEWRANMNARYSVNAFDLDLRARYYSSMENRMGQIFPGESFTGVPSVWYWDGAVSWNVNENATLRLGVNNIFDKQPPEYAPNVQSGTEPSLYDVVGRRVYGQIGLRF